MKYMLLVCGDETADASGVAPSNPGPRNSAPNAAYGSRSYDPIGALTAGAALVICVYALVEARSTAPFVPLRLLRSPSVSGSNLVFLFGSCAIGMSYALSRYGQVVLGLSPLRFGLYNVVLRRSGPTVRTERSSDVTVRQVRS